MQGVGVSYRPVVGGEGRTFYSPPGIQIGTSGTRVVLGFHGFTGGYRDPANFETPEGYLSMAASEGRLCCTADWGGDTWGNDATVGSGGLVDQALALCGAMGAKVDGGIWLYAGSMGAATATNWATRNKSKVAAMALIQPAVNLVKIHDVVAGGAASIEAAYGGLAGWNAAKATHDPMQFASGMTGVPTKVWYSTGDATIDPVDPPAYASLAGAAVQIMPGAPPHGTIPSLAGEILPFLKAHP